MHLAMAPDESADFSGIPVHEADAHKSIYNRLKRGSDTQSLICCVEKSTGCIRGYLNLGYFNDQMLHLNHLIRWLRCMIWSKVQRELQRHGIASLNQTCDAVPLQLTLHFWIDMNWCSKVGCAGWAFNKIDLKVSLWSHKAISFYNAMGFVQQARRTKRQRSALANWITMSNCLIWWDLYSFQSFWSHSTGSTIDLCENVLWSVSMRRNAEYCHILPLSFTWFETAIRQKIWMHIQCRVGMPPKNNYT